MKYTIEGFSQEKMVDFGIRLPEALILRWIVDFQATGKMEKYDIEGNTYYWVSYKNLIANLPILGIKSTKSLARYLKSLTDSGILLRKEIKIKYGTKVVYAFGNNYEQLIQDSAPDKSVQCPPDNSVQSDSSIKDSSKKDINIPPSVDEVKAYCKERKNGIDAEHFVAFYNAKGWMIGKNKMKDWKSAIITWEKNDKKDNPKKNDIHLAKSIFDGE